MLFAVELEQLSSRMGNTIDSATKQTNIQHDQKMQSSFVVGQTVKIMQKRHTVPHALLSMSYMTYVAKRARCTKFVFGAFTSSFYCSAFAVVGVIVVIISFVPFFLVSCVLCVSVPGFHGTYVHNQR